MNLKMLIPLTFSTVSLVSIPSVVCSCGKQPKPGPQPTPTQKIECIVDQTEFNYCVTDNLYIDITINIKKENIPDGELKLYSYPNTINFYWTNEYSQTVIMDVKVPCNFKKTSLDVYSFSLSDTTKKVWYYLQSHPEINLAHSNPWHFGLSGYYEENGNQHLCSIPTFYITLSD